MSNLQFVKTSETTSMNPTASQIAAIKESLDSNPYLNDYARAQSLENMLHDLTKPRMSREEAIEQYKMIARQSQSCSRLE